jgi:phage gp46-like protein
VTDLALLWRSDAWSADFGVAGGDLMTDDGLKTAVIISLFTDARVRADDPLPADGDRKGWWGDALPAVQGDEIGSRLWLLAREKFLPSVVARAREYATEALAWLLRDGIAATVEVFAEAIRPQTLAIAVEITRPGGPGRLRYDFTWEATANAV